MYLRCNRIEHWVHRIGKAQTQSSYPLTPPPPTPSRVKHIYISHTPPTLPIPRTTLFPSTSTALDNVAEPTYSCPALTTTTLPPSCTHPRTLSAYSHPTQTIKDASQSLQPPHPHIGYQDNLTDRPKTTT